MLLVVYSPIFDDIDALKNYVINSGILSIVLINLRTVLLTEYLFNRWIES